MCKALSVIGHIRSQTEYSSHRKLFSVVARLNLQECLHENGQKRAERCSAPLLLRHQQPEEMGWCLWRGCDVVSMPEPPWYHTLRWKTSQTVLAHHSSNYQHQECPFISVTSFFLSSHPTPCLPLLPSRLCPRLLHLRSPSALSF